MVFDEVVLEACKESGSVLGIDGRNRDGGVAGGFVRFVEFGFRMVEVVFGLVRVRRFVGIGFFRGLAGKVVVRGKHPKDDGKVGQDKEEGKEEFEFGVGKVETRNGGQENRSETIDERQVEREVAVSVGPEFHPVFPEGDHRESEEERAKEYGKERMAVVDVRGDGVSGDKALGEETENGQRFVERWELKHRKDY